MPKRDTRQRPDKKLRATLGLVALVTITVFLALLALAKAPGVLEVPALDHAQLARQVAEGQGFSTALLRPLSLGLFPHAQPHPDLVNPPLHSLLVAVLYFLTEPSGKMAIGLGVGLWLLSVWMVFGVARYWWDTKVAVFAALFYVTGVGALTAAMAALPHPLMTVLVCGAFWAVFPKSGSLREGDASVAVWRVGLAGVLCGAAILTDYRLLPLALVLGMHVFWTQPHRATATGLFAMGLVLAVGPWVIRNLSLPGNPVFGLYWYGLLENTRQFPGESIWQTMAEPPNPFLYLLLHPVELLSKAGIGLSHYRTAGLTMVEPLVGVLFAVALVGAPAGGHRKRLAWVTLTSLGLSVGLACLLPADARLLSVWLPLLACVAAAQLVAWVGANLESFPIRLGKGQPVLILLAPAVVRLLVYTGIVGVVSFPLVMFFGQLRSVGDRAIQAAAQAVGKRIPAGGVVLTDRPALTAWYLNRPSLWLCQKETDLARLEELTGRIRGVYISPALGMLNPPERGDWWQWVATSRGIYRGLSTLPDSPFPGFWRLPADEKSKVEESQWLTDLQQAARNNPDSAEAQAQLAGGYAAAGRLQEAYQAFQEATRRDPFYLEAQVGMWQTMAQLTQPDGTLRLAQLVTKTPPQDPHAKPLLEQAVAHFQQAAAQQPGDPWLLLNLILCRSRLGQWEELQQDYARLAVFLPKTFPPRLLLANLYLQQGALEQAATECTQLVREYPDVPTVHQFAARVWMAQEKFEDALTELTATIRLRPQWATAHLQAGEVCQKLHREAAAVEHLQAALRLAPQQVNIKLTLAGAYVAQEKTAEAIGLYSQILATDPKQLVALNNYVELLTRTGRAAEALPLARQGVNLYPQSPFVRDTAGWTAFQAGQLDEALLHLREAIRLAPQHGITYYHLGKLLLAQNQKPEGLAAFRQALQCGLLEPTRQEVQKLLAGD